MAVYLRTRVVLDIPVSSNRPTIMNEHVDVSARDDIAEFLM
jgi:hypothetical protein